MPTVVVTGCNRGIGLALCRQLAGRGDDVVGACRERSDELDALGIEVVEGVDVTDQAGIDRLAGALAGRTIDVLVHCAGILTRETLEDLDLGRIRAQLEVNALGPLRVTAALLPCLGEGSKVAIVTSRMGSIADNTSGSRYGYRMSKAAVNMAGMSLARDLEDRGIAVGIFHPGMVATEMTGRQGIPPAEAAEGLVARTDELTLETTGEFRHANGEALPW